MFVEPDAAESKVAIKADPTAPARSAIRRQRTVRYSPSVRDHQSTLSTLLSRNQSRSQGRMRLLADRRSLLEDIQRRGNSSTSSPSPDEAQDVEAEADLAHTQASQRSRLESGRALLRDALSYERPSRRTGPTPAAAEAWRRPGESVATEEAAQAWEREIQERRNAQRTGADAPPPPVYRQYRSPPTSQEMVPPPPGYMPSPPYTSGDTSTRSSPYVPTPPLGSASLTPRFAPAHRLDSEDEAQANIEREQVLARLATRMAELSDDGEREYVAGHRAEINRMRSRNPGELSLEYREAEAAYLESVETRLNLMRRMRDSDLSELPPLYRMSRPFQEIVRATRGHPHSNMDGLGDRERSFSPDDDQWETMLTTIQPDERVPSTHSSFTSATASASSLSSNSASSSGTLITAPSTSTDAEFCPAEFDDSEDETIDTLDSQLAQAESQARRIQALSDRISRQPDFGEHDFARQRRWVEREDELHQMEANLRRLERQISEERPVAAGRRRYGRRERL